MLEEFRAGSEFFEQLERADARIVARVARGGCQHCGGRLHRGDYERKPRGGLFAAEGEHFCRRFSLCCDREGCRKRATPPSLRFLGRRVYLAVTVVVASAIAQTLAAVEAIQRATGVPARTTKRWLDWWAGSFRSTSVFVELCTRMLDLSVQALPSGWLSSLLGSHLQRLQQLLPALSPLSTATVLDGSRFVRGIG